MIDTDIPTTVAFSIGRAIGFSRLETSLGREGLAELTQGWEERDLRDFHLGIGYGGSEREDWNTPRSKARRKVAATRPRATA